MAGSYTYHNPEKRCSQCMGTGKIRVTNSVKISYREYSDSYVQECNECDGTGLETIRWLSKSEYKRLVELDQRYSDLKSGRYVPQEKKKKSRLLYSLVGFGIGLCISGGNMAFGLFFAFLGLALSCK